MITHRLGSAFNLPHFRILLICKFYLFFRKHSKAMFLMNRLKAILKIRTRAYSDSRSFSLSFKSRLWSLGIGLWFDWKFLWKFSLFNAFSLLSCKTFNIQKETNTKWIIETQTKIKFLLYKITIWAYYLWDAFINFTQFLLIISYNGEIFFNGKIQNSLLSSICENEW